MKPGMSVYCRSAVIHYNSVGFKPLGCLCCIKRATRDLEMNKTQYLIFKETIESGT